MHRPLFTATSSLRSGYSLSILKTRVENVERPSKSQFGNRRQIRRPVVLHKSVLRLRVSIDRDVRIAGRCRFDTRDLLHRSLGIFLPKVEAERTGNPGTLIEMLTDQSSMKRHTHLDRQLRCGEEGVAPAEAQPDNADTTGAGAPRLGPTDQPA